MRLHRMCDLQTRGSHQGFGCKVRGSLQGQIARRGDGNEDGEGVEVLCKSEHSRFEISSGSFHLGEVPQTQAKAELRNQFSCVIFYYLLHFWLLFTSFILVIYFTVSVLFISCILWKCSATDKEHLLTTRLFQ